MEIILREPGTSAEPNLDFERSINLMAEYQQQELPIYLKFIDGDRKGSIARWNKMYDDVISPNIQRTRNGGYNHSIKGMHGHCTWDGRNNKIQWSLNSPQTVWLRGYQGPTVWCKFDAKEAKRKLLKNPGQVDIDGKELDVGDEVLYVNSRYGTGTNLCHGAVARFEAKADSRSHTIYTIVKERDSNEESKIQYSSDYIFKKKITRV